MSMSKRATMVTVYALECIGVPSGKDVGPEWRRVPRECGARSLSHISSGSSQAFS